MVPSGSAHCNQNNLCVGWAPGPRVPGGWGRALAMGETPLLGVQLPHSYPGGLGSARLSATQRCYSHGREEEQLNPGSSVMLFQPV